MRLFAGVLEYCQLLLSDTVHTKGACAILLLYFLELFSILLHQEGSCLLLDIFTEFATRYEISLRASMFPRLRLLEVLSLLICLLLAFICTALVT